MFLCGALEQFTFDLRCRSTNVPPHLGLSGHGAMSVAEEGVAVGLGLSDRTQPSFDE